MKFTICKGWHYSLPFRFKIRKTNEIKFEFEIDWSWLFTPVETDDYDINKLFGFSTGWNHTKRSARFGWRPTEDGKQIEIWSYVRDEGTIDTPRQPLAVVNPRTKCYGSIEDTGYSYIFHIKTRKFKRTQEVAHFPHNRVSWRYLLYPYFGGNKTAPHKMKFNINLL